MHSSFDGHLGCFQFEDIMNKAAVNIRLQMDIGFHFSQVHTWECNYWVLSRCLFNFIRHDRVGYFHVHFIAQAQESLRDLNKSQKRKR